MKALVCLNLAKKSAKERPKAEIAVSAGAAPGTCGSAVRVRLVSRAGGLGVRGTLVLPPDLCCVAAGGPICNFVRETRGRSPKQIQQNWKDLGKRC